MKKYFALKKKYFGPFFYIITLAKKSKKIFFREAFISKRVLAQIIFSNFFH
jgi:hypothetical protein